MICYKSLTNFITLPWVDFDLTTLVVIGTDCIDSYKSNYQTITTTTAPYINVFNTQLIKVENKCIIYVYCWKISIYFVRT